MNVLSTAYQDACYSAYLDTNPLLAVAVVDDDDRKLEVSLLQAEGGDFSFCVSSVNGIRDICQRRRASSKDDGYTGILKSNWCYKHQHQKFSCIIVKQRWQLCISSDDKNRDKLRSFLETVKKSVAGSSCRIVVVCTGSVSSMDISEPQLEEVRRTMKALLGTNFGSMMIYSSDLDDGIFSARLRGIAADACIQYHQDEIVRLRKKKESLQDERVDFPKISRLYFQGGWHLMCIRQHKEAAKFFRSAFKLCRNRSLIVPTFEQRICASFFLWHLIAAASLCGDTLFVGSVMYMEVRDFIDWAGAALSTDIAPNCALTINILKHFLVAEWCELLARKTHDLDARIQQDLLFAAGDALKEVVSFLPTEMGEKLAVLAPTYIGIEGTLDAYTSIIIGCTSRTVINARVSNLIEEAASVDSGRRCERIIEEFIRPSQVSTTASSKKIPLADDFFSSTFTSDMIISDICTRVASVTEGDFKQMSVENVLPSFLHACVDPKHVLQQAYWRKRLSRICSVNCLPETLRISYPHGSFQAPFSPYLDFGMLSCEAGGTKINISICLCTTSLLPITVSDISATFTSIDEHSTAVVVNGYENIVLQQDKVQKIFLQAAFSVPGMYVCTSITSKCALNDVEITICWNFPIPNREERLNLLYGSFLPCSGPRHAIYAFNPSSFVDVQCNSLVEAVEGDNVELRVSIYSRGPHISHGSITFPSLSKLLRVTDAGDAAEIFLPALNGGEAVPYTQVPFGTIISKSHVNVSIKWTCLRSGSFDIPLAFKLSSEMQGDVEVRRRVRFTVYNPFNASFSYFGSQVWSDVGAAFYVPSVRRLWEQEETNVLIKPHRNRVAEFAAVGNSDALLFYGEKATTNTAVFFTAGINSPVNVITRLSCSSRKGLSIFMTEVVCNRDVDLLYSSHGEWPCSLDNEEDATIATQLSFTQKGVCVPGFLRVHFTPKDSTGMLMVDFPFPRVDVVAEPVELSLEYPSYAIYGVSVRVVVRVRNNLSVPFNGELTVDARNNCFSFSGRSRWIFAVGSHSEVVTDFVITPLCRGEVALPSLQLRDTSKSSVVASSKEIRLISVLPEAEDALRL